MVSYILPSPHVGGTSKATLIADQLSMLHGLRKAREWIVAAEPNGRDYLGRIKDWRAVRAKHVARLAQIDAMIAEIEAYSEALDQM
ncbi:MAG: hypothetical protein FJX31_07375 [Alphaproteobacteria bacterium]|nr:hypothetical protein [Alphaproteobacteria bacterium]